MSVDDERMFNVGGSGNGRRPSPIHPQPPAHTERNADAELSLTLSLARPLVEGSNGSSIRRCEDSTAAGGGASPLAELIRMHRLPAVKLRRTRDWQAAKTVLRPRRSESDNIDSPLCRSDVCGTDPAGCTMVLRSTMKRIRIRQLPTMQP